MRALLLSLLASVFVSACGGETTVSPSTVPTPRVTSTSTTTGASLANWRGDATVLSATDAGGCGWGRTPGETRVGVLWRVTIDGSSILLDEDMANWPTDHADFRGTLNGREFSAKAPGTGGVCYFTGATIIGTFSTDFSSFEAHETITWGATQVERRWVVRRLQVTVAP
jgi:hypothetical protein